MQHYSSYHHHTRTPPLHTPRTLSKHTTNCTRFANIQAQQPPTYLRDARARLDGMDNMNRSAPYDEYDNFLHKGATAESG